MWNIVLGKRTKTKKTIRMRNVKQLFEDGTNFVFVNKQNNKDNIVLIRGSFLLPLNK